MTCIKFEGGIICVPNETTFTDDDGHVWVVDLQSWGMPYIFTKNGRKYKYGWPKSKAFNKMIDELTPPPKGM